MAKKVPLSWRPVTSAEWLLASLKVLVLVLFFIIPVGILAMGALASFVENFVWFATQGRWAFPPWLTTIFFICSGVFLAGFLGRSFGDSGSAFATEVWNAESLRGIIGAFFRGMYGGDSTDDANQNINDESKSANR